MKKSNDMRKKKNDSGNLYERFERCMAQIVHNGVNMSAKGKYGISSVIVSLDELCRRTYLTDMPTLEQRRELEEFLENLNSNFDKYKVVTSYPIGITRESPMFSVMDIYKYGETGMVLYEMVINSAFSRYLEDYLYSQYDELEQDASRYAPTSEEDVCKFYEDRAKHIANRKFRRLTKTRLTADKEPPARLREVSDTYNFSSDGLPRWRNNIDKKYLRK